MLFEPLSGEDRTAVIEEAEELLAFAAGDTGAREIRLV